LPVASVSTSETAQAPVLILLCAIAARNRVFCSAGLVVRPVAAAKRVRQEAAAVTNAGSDGSGGGRPAPTSALAGLPSPPAPTGTTAAAAASGLGAAREVGGSPGLAASSGAASFAGGATASAAGWHSKLVPPRRLPPRLAQQRLQGAAQPAVHLYPSPVAAAVAAAPLLPSVGVSLGVPGLSGAAGIGAHRAHTAAGPREGSRGTAVPQPGPAPAALVGPDGSVAVGPGGLSEAGGQQQRQREELEELLHHDNAEGMHVGVPNVGDPAVGAQRRRPAPQQQERQAHVTPHLPRQASAGAGPKQQGAQQSRGATPAAQQLQRQGQRSPGEQDGSPGEGSAAVDVANPSAQLGLASGERAAGAAASARHVGPSPREGSAACAGSAQAASARASPAAAAEPSVQQGPPVHKTASLLPAPMLPKPPAAADTPTAGPGVFPAHAASSSRYGDAASWELMYSKVYSALALHQEFCEAYGGDDALLGEDELQALHEASVSRACSLQMF
jgi:hypothetical protein